MTPALRFARGAPEGVTKCGAIVLRDDQFAAERRERIFLIA